MLAQWLMCEGKREGVNLMAGNNLVWLLVHQAAAWAVEL